MLGRFARPWSSVDTDDNIGHEHTAAGTGREAATSLNRVIMVERLWHGWTTPDNADRYEVLLRTEIFPGIAARGVPGYRGIRLLRRSLPSGEVEFLTIMSFDTWDAVRLFAGDEYERAYVPASARAVLARYDERSAHYELRERLAY